MSLISCTGVDALSTGPCQSAGAAGGMHCGPGGVPGGAAAPLPGVHLPGADEHSARGELCQQV